MRRALLAIPIFLALGPIPGTHQRFPVDNLADSVAAIPLAAPPVRAGSLRFVRGWQLTSPHSRFGGFSALARVGAGRFQLAGDNGYWARLTLPMKAAPAAVEIAPLPTPGGQPRRKSMIDVEAMMVDPATGKSWIALERIDEIWRLDAALERIEARRRLPPPGWPTNSGAEAMARLADGRTILFSEGAADDARGTAALVYRGDPAVAAAPPLHFLYDAEGRGRVSDAAVLPDGRVLIVHRRMGFDPIFTTILAILDPADIREGAVVRSRTVGRVPEALAENYEGADVAVEGERTFVWLVSDDGFNVWQRSLLVQFELVDLPPRSKKAAR